MLNNLYHKRCHNYEVYDKLSLEVVPRYKTSELSGDEWRISVHAKWFFKGVLIKETTYHDMQAALMMLPGEWLNEVPIPGGILAKERQSCDQPGCSQKAVGRLQLKRETDAQGNWLEPTSLMPYRQFCLTHIERGDCSREDCDDNYIPLDKVAAPDSQNVEEHPSIFGGVLDLTEEDTSPPGEG